jgi:hypothetical protein
MRGIFYIDGFNFYYLRMKWASPFKWLNVKALADRISGPNVDIARVDYYTANVSGKVDHGAPNRQQAYFRALNTVPEIAIHKGQFLTSEKWSVVVHPARAKPDGYVWAQPEPDLVYVKKTEEKGSDVNLASHLLRDAYTGQMDIAYVLTNDTDLVEPIRIVTQEIGLQVCIVAPCRQRNKRIPIPSPSLAHVSTSKLYIDDADLAACQFPDPIIIKGKSPIRRPATWV